MKCYESKCISCELIDTCSYHRHCSSNYGSSLTLNREYVSECDDYVYSKEIDEYFGGC